MRDNIMISINRNNKGILVEAKGKRVMKSSLYSKDNIFEISRSKFNDFLSVSYTHLTLPTSDLV